MVLTHARKVSTRQYIANDLIKSEELRKLKDAEDGEVLKVEGNSRSQDILSPIMDAPLSVDVYKAYELINSSIVQLSSISEYRRSAMPDKQRKATEAVYIEQGTEMSTNAKAEDVQEHCEEIARKLFILLRNEDNIQTREITYKDEKANQYITQEYNRDSFPGEYSFRWESGVAAPLNAGTRYQKALGLLNTISTITAANPQLAQTINWTELLRSVLQDSEIKNIEEILTPEQPMIPPEMQGMEGQIPPEGMPPEEGMPMEGQEQVDPELMNMVMQSMNRGQ